MPEIPTLLIPAAISVVVAYLTAELRQRSERRMKREDHLTELLTKYREPLVRAAYDLQSRLHNIAKRGFLAVYLVTDEEYAIRSTQWLIGQYLGWVEILRREVQFLDLGHLQRNRELVSLEDKVRWVLADDGMAAPLRIFRAEQRAIGELMIDGDDCIGYAAFLRKMASDDDIFKNRFNPLEADLRKMGAEPDSHLRAIHLQRALIDLVEFLDEGGFRFPEQARDKLALPAQG